MCEKTKINGKKAGDGPFKKKQIKIKRTEGRGSGEVISILAFYSGHLTLNLTKDYSANGFERKKRNGKETRDGPIQNRKRATE